MTSHLKNKDGNKQDDRRILIVGLAALDLVTVVGRYPVEDSDTRVSSQRWSSGGNAVNSAVILSQLEANIECLATIAADPSSQKILQDLDQYDVIHENCVYHQSCETPLSVVIVSETSGSRTILHKNRSLPELKFEDFDKLNLSSYKWIHFEARNVSEVLKMISKIKLHNRGVSENESITVSVEVEKTREENKLLFQEGDVVFVSKEYAKFQGHNTATECMEANSTAVRQGARLICAWGDEGAWGRDKDGQIHSSTAFKPEQVLETLAAGDTFNAGVISALSRGETLKESVTFGCRLAGYKCGLVGRDIKGFSKW